jgi:hypothetical protein
MLGARPEGGMVMDNILITSSEDVARSYALKTWSVRNKVIGFVPKFSDSHQTAKNYISFIVFARLKRPRNRDLQVDFLTNSFTLFSFSGFDLLFFSSRVHGLLQ